eukprot:Hpha_TRINITY_DN15217_c0_g4::TRINITY_DN15217_c0_g4_i1::g.66346::m.66346
MHWPPRLCLPPRDISYAHTLFEFGRGGGLRLLCPYRVANCTHSLSNNIPDHVGANKVSDYITSNICTIRCPDHVGAIEVSNPGSNHKFPDRCPYHLSADKVSNHKFPDRCPYHLSADKVS